MVAASSPRCSTSPPTCTRGRAYPGYSPISQVFSELLAEGAPTRSFMVTYLASQYQHLAARRGHKKAVTAVAHSILRIVWHLLAHDCEYVDLGSRYLEEGDRQHIQRRLIRRLEAFGYIVKLEPAA